MYIASCSRAVIRTLARLLAMETAVAEGREVIGAGPFVPSLASATLGDCLAAAARARLRSLPPREPHRVRQGPADARVVMVGEQPGDQEDRRAPPSSAAGEVFDRALAKSAGT